MSKRVLKLKLQDLIAYSNERSFRGLTQDVIANVTINPDGSCNMNINLVFATEAEAEFIEIPEGGLPLGENIAYIQLEDNTNNIRFTSDKRDIIFDTTISNTEFIFTFKGGGKQKGLGGNKQGGLDTFIISN
jgi:hypothetical protein